MFAPILPHTNGAHTIPLIGGHEHPEVILRHPAVKDVIHYHCRAFHSSNATKDTVVAERKVSDLGINPLSSKAPRAAIGARLWIKS